MKWPIDDSFVYFTTSIVINVHGVTNMTVRISTDGSSMEVGLLYFYFYDKISDISEKVGRTLGRYCCCLMVDK